MSLPEIGRSAPEFELKDNYGQLVRLADFRGYRSVVLVFFPLAFTPTCTGELTDIRDADPSFEEQDAAVLAVSCDSTASLRVFGEQQGITHPLLSDFWPHGEVSRSYGVFLESKGFANRGTFVIDREGILRWTVVTSPGEARDISQLREVLATLAGAVH